MLTTGKIHGMSLTIAATLAAVAFFQTGQASADPLGFASPFNFGSLPGRIPMTLKEGDSRRITLVERSSFSPVMGSR